MIKHVHLRFRFGRCEPKQLQGTGRNEMSCVRNVCFILCLKNMMNLSSFTNNLVLLTLLKFTDEFLHKFKQKIRIRQTTKSGAKEHTKSKRENIMKDLYQEFS